MKITEIKIVLVSNESVAAYASVVFDGQFVVKNIRIVRTLNGLIVCMPSKKINAGDNSWHIDFAFPINEEFRKYLNGEIIKKYNIVSKK
jgi:stage V sporulation protein G